MKIIWNQNLKFDTTKGEHGKAGWVWIQTRPEAGVLVGWRGSLCDLLADPQPLGRPEQSVRGDGTQPLELAADTLPAGVIYLPDAVAVTAGELGPAGAEFIQRRSRFPHPGSPGALGDPAAAGSDAGTTPIG